MEEQMEVNELKESLEKMDELIRENEQHDVKEEAKDRLLSQIALSTAIIAVIAAIIGLFSGQATSEAMLAKNEALLFQDKATNAWGYYQAKSIKGHIYEVDAELFPAHKADFEDKIAKYETDKAAIKKDAEAFEKKSEEKNKESEKYNHRHHILEFSETFIHVAIALSAISALTRKRRFWLISILISLIGLGFFIMGIVI